jgi:hypothetical protein
MGVLDFIDVGFFKKKIFEDLNLLWFNSQLQQIVNSKYEIKYSS